jgi:hypothetical protein
LKAIQFRYDEGKPLLEQLALLQALATVVNEENLDTMMSYYIVRDVVGFPSEFVGKVKKRGPVVPIDEIWRIARKQALTYRVREIIHARPVKRRRGKGK